MKEHLMLTYEQTVRSEFLQGRYLVLELAALLDRVDEAAGRSGVSPSDDPAVRQLIEAVSLLTQPSAKADRAERLLRHYTGSVEC
jgi:hypothetical protein